MSKYTICILQDSDLTLSNSHNQHSKGAPWFGEADKNGFLPISQHYIYADGRNNRYIAIFFCETVISQKGGDPLQGKESEKKIMALFSNAKSELYSEATERCGLYVYEYAMVNLKHRLSYDNGPCYWTRSVMWVLMEWNEVELNLIKLSWVEFSSVQFNSIKSSRVELKWSEVRWSKEKWNEVMSWIELSWVEVIDGFDLQRRMNLTSTPTVLER